MVLKHDWADNNGIQIHFIDSNPDSKENYPFVIIPGLSESAEDYIPLMELLLPRRCIAITLRGRGKSDAPKENYTLEDHVSDIDAVVRYLDLSPFFLMGYSRGVSYTLGYALDHLHLLNGLIIGDYPALHSKLPPGWVEFFSSLPPWRGKPLDERMQTHALQRLQEESSLVLFWDDLSKIQCPVLIIRGGKQGSGLSEENSAKYLEHIPHAKSVVLEDSDHNIFEPDLAKVTKTIDSFLRGSGNVSIL